MHLADRLEALIMLKYPGDTKCEIDILNLCENRFTGHTPQAELRRTLRDSRYSPRDVCCIQYNTANHRPELHQNDTNPELVE